MVRPATRDEIRKSYNKQGFEKIRINSEGRIAYFDGIEWCEGRWISEYVINEDGLVFLR